VSLAAPIILANLTQPIVSAVDTGVAGHLPDPSFLGAVALGGLFFNFIFWGFGFLRMGTTGLVAQAYGAQNNAALRATLARAVWLSFSIGAVVLVAQNPLIRAALQLLGGSANVESNARLYCHARVWSAPLALANYVLLGYLLGVQKVRLALLIQLVINLVNIAAVFGYVFGLGLGLSGIGWAAATADCAGFVLGAVLVARLMPPGLGRLGWQELVDAHALKKLWLINLNLFLRTVCLLASFGWFARSGAREGDVILAANALLLNFQTFMAYALDGFAHASEALVGEAIGAQDRMALKSAIRVTTFWAGMTAAGFVAVYAIVGPTLIDMLTDLSQVRAQAERYLPWAVISPLISVWGFQLDGVFIGATRTRDLFLAMAVSSATFVLCAVFFESRLGNDGLWLALLVLMGMRGATLGALLPRLARQVTPEVPPGTLSAQAL
jgi:MATE family multidrug resistance protein